MRFVIKLRLPALLILSLIFILLFKTSTLSNIGNARKFIRVFMFEVPLFMGRLRLVSLGR